MGMNRHRLVKHIHDGLLYLIRTIVCLFDRPLTRNQHMHRDKFAATGSPG
ncbi:hypothetical protein SDC9_142651 [bioreactor metagenome]|uniref:Uncharacterized protein n=1 Tax=bioreactor metagenome TaxID=1076179 RepID=A0A645E1F1_9ZZZZ